MDDFAEVAAEIELGARAPATATSRRLNGWTLPL
jgi:hypothetical protein